MTPVVKIASQVANRLVDCLNVANVVALGAPARPNILVEEGLNEHANNTEGSLMITLMRKQFFLREERSPSQCLFDVAEE